MRSKRVVQKFQVELFLAQFKNFAKKKGIIFYRDKPKNVQTVNELGISFEDCEEHLLELTPEDYVEGPTNSDAVFGADRWVFQKEIEGEKIYIRLKVDTDNEIVTCESFHFAEHFRS